MAEKSEITKMPKMEKMAKSEITKMPKMEKMAKSEIIRENGVLMTENKRIEAISVKRKIDLEEKLKEELMNRRKREFLNKKF
ncbi:hypothetical protein MHBO_003751 [Bonamia ostreae]|uniref:Uncharacterized protein n=1 Tax=Bonamia ostreae TaxID=126728 RepID=A0ABV2ARY4_9EUKA